MSTKASNHNKVNQTMSMGKTILTKTKAEQGTNLGDDSVLCKVCKKYLRSTTILKHISHGNKCKTHYNTQEIQILKEQAAERKKLKRVSREKLYGDPEKRARKRRESYDPKKRKEIYHGTQFYQNHCKSIIEIRERYEMEGRSKNSSELKSMTSFFENMVSDVISTSNDSDLTLQIQEKISTMRENIQKTYQKIEMAIDKMVEESKEIIDNNKALKNAFIQILPSENQNESDMIYDTYHDLKLDYDFVFKDLTEKLGKRELYIWKFACLCQKCSSRKNFSHHSIVEYKGHKPLSCQSCKKICHGRLALFILDSFALCRKCIFQKNSHCAFQNNLRQGIFEFQGDKSMACISCKKICQQSRILKHVIRGKCKSQYTDGELQKLRDIAQHWNKKRKIEKNRLRYDPAKYAKNLKAMQEENQLLNAKRELPDDLEYWAEKARKCNTENFQEMVKKFERGSFHVKFCNQGASGELEDKVNAIWSHIDESNKQVLGELDEKFEFSKSATIEVTSLGKPYCTINLEELYCTINNVNYYKSSQAHNCIVAFSNHWDIIEVKMVFAFKAIIDQMNVEFDWSVFCPFTVCKHDEIRNGLCVNNFFFKFSQGWNKYLPDAEAKLLDKMKKALPHECVICNIRFGGKTHLRKHYIFHKKEKHPKSLLLCLKCNTLFPTKEDLKVHTTSVHKRKK